MRKDVARIYAFIWLIIGIALSVNAQNKCSANLSEAKELFNAGQIERIPSLLDSCIHNGFAREEKIQATLLLIQVYLFDSDRDKANQLMIFFLQNFPDYQIQPTDPVEFIELFKSIKVKPTWGLGIRLANNIPEVSVSQHYSTDNLNHLNSSYSPDGLSLDAAIHVNRYVSPNFWFSMDLGYSMLNIQRTDYMENHREELYYSEKTGWFSLPLYCNLSLGKGKLSPYFYAGGDFRYLYMAKSYLLRRNLTDPSIPDVIQKSTNILENRKLINIWALGGIGLQYKAMGGYLSVGFDFNYSLLPYVNGKNRYSNQNKLYYYQYIDDDFTIDHFSCSISYTKLFYKIKKKR